MGRLRSQPIGLDVDQGALKAVQLSRGGNLQHVGYRRLPSGVISDGEVADHDRLANEIREMWSSHSFRGDSVHLGVANQKVVVRLMDLPRMSSEDLKGAINFEAREQIPMPIEDAVLDHVVLGPASEGSELDRILLIAAQKDMISRYASAVRAGGLRPAGVDVKALSLMRSILPEGFSGGENGAVLLLDIGTELSNLVVSQNGNPTLTRFVSGGFAYLIRSVAQTADLSEQEAESRATSLSSGMGSEEGEEREDDPAFASEVRRGLEEAMQVLAEDVQRSVEYHYFQPGAQEVSRAFVSGEGALISGMESYLSELLGLPVYRGGPLQRISSNRSNVADEQLRVMEPVLAVAIGLALEGE